MPNTHRDPTDPRAALDEVGWTESGSRFELEDGFSVVPCSNTPGGFGSPGLGWNLYAPGGQVFGWAATLTDVAEKIARERVEKLFSSRSVRPQAPGAALWLAILHAAVSSS